MTKRRYTVAEIDELHEVLRTKYLFGRYHHDPLKDEIVWSRTYNETDMLRSVGVALRTHMIAGHTAQDLIDSEKPYGHA